MNVKPTKEEILEIANYDSLTGKFFNGFHENHGKETK